MSRDKHPPTPQLVRQEVAFFALLRTLFFGRFLTHFSQVLSGIYPVAFRPLLVP